MPIIFTPIILDIARQANLYDQDLNAEEIDSIQKYKKLSEEGKRLVRLIINEEYARTITKSQLTLPCYLPGVRKLHTGFLMQTKLSSAHHAKRSA